MKNLFQHRVVWGRQADRPIKELLKDKKVETFNDAISLLPPAFYTVNMTFKEVQISFRVQDHPESNWVLTGDNEFTLGKMSSGERQMLYRDSRKLVQTNLTI